MNNVSEEAAERAVEKLRLIINAAENSNQAGENAAVAAAAWSPMLEALRDVESWLVTAGYDGRPGSFLEHVRSAIARAEGRDQ